MLSLTEGLKLAIGIVDLAWSNRRWRRGARKGFSSGIFFFVYKFNAGAIMEGTLVLSLLLASGYGMKAQ
jgi:hypothetical protein